MRCKVNPLQRADCGVSREHSQPDPRYHPERVVSNITRMNPPPLSLEARSDAISKFGLDCAYYQRTKRELFTNGWSEEQIFGRYEIDVDALLFGLSNPDESQAVSTWCSQMVNKILPATALPVRLASAYLLTKMMRVSCLANRWLVIMVTNIPSVSHLADDRKHECKSRLADAAGEQTRIVSR